MLVIIRRRNLWLGCLLVLLLVGILFGRAFQCRTVHSPLRTVVVAVDPGHGGVDGGCGGGAWQEKHVNLSVGLDLRDFLRQAGIRTRLTRTCDVALDTELRPGRHRRDLARRTHLFKQAALFISIHCDWSGDSRRSGPAVFYRYSRPDSKRLAETVQNELNGWAHLKRKAEPGNYFILKNAIPPGVIVEAGFLSNPADRARLQSPEYQAALAAAIGRGVLRYLGTSP